MSNALPEHFVFETILVIMCQCLLFVVVRFLVTEHISLSKFEMSLLVGGWRGGRERRGMMEEVAYR